MPTTRKRIIKTVYKDENSDEEEGGDFSDSGSEAIISDASSSEDDIISESSSPEEEFDDDESLNKSKRQYPAKKSKVARKFTKKTNKKISGCDMLESHPVFSIKDLTETDKLLPPILNLSESDSSDEESPHLLNRSSFTSIPLTDQDNVSDNEVNGEYRNVWSNIEKAQDESEEIAKKTFMELEHHKSKIEETKATLQNYTLKIKEQDSDVKDLLALGEEVLAIPEVSTVNKKTKLKSRKDDSDSDIEDWEEVKDTKSMPQQGIQLVVEFPNTTRKQPKTIDVEMMMKRKINKVKKEYQVYMHKVHVLCWLGHGNYITSVLNDRVIMAAALSLVPSKERRPKHKVNIKYIEEIITCYKDYVKLKLDKNEEKFKPKAPPLKKVLLDLIKKKTVTSKKYLLFIFVTLLRALGLQCRIMFNFVTLPIKPPATELCSLSTKPKNKSESKFEKQNLTIGEPKSAETITAMLADEENKANTKPRTRKANKKNISQIDGNYDVSSDDEMWEGEFDEINFIYEYNGYENIMQVDGGDDGPSTRRTRSNKRNIADVVGKIKDENLSPSKKTRKNPTSMNQNVTSDENKNIDVNKTVKRRKNAVETKEKYKVNKHTRTDNSNLKELTNIAPEELTEINITPTKPPRKSPRGTIQQTPNDNKKKDTILHKRSKRNPELLDVTVKSNQPADESEMNNFKILDENISSLKITRKSTRRNTPIPIAKTETVGLVNRTKRRGKTIVSKIRTITSDNSITQNSNVIECPILASEISEEDVSPPKKFRNNRGLSSLTPLAKSGDNKDKNTNKRIQRRNKILDTSEKYDPSDHNTSDSNNVIATNRSLTRSQKSELANDGINEQQKNDKNTKRKATRNSTNTTSDDLKIPQVILSREIRKHVTRKNVANTNPKEIQYRATRKRPQTADTTISKGTNTAKESMNKAKKITKSVFSVAMEENEGETSLNNSKISVKEELSESKQTVDKRLTRLNKHERVEDTKKEKINSKSRKKSLKGNTKKELHVDEDYTPIDDPKHHHSDSDDSFKPTKFSPKPRNTSLRADRRVLSSSTANGTSTKNKVDMWCEVFVEETQEWISVDIINGKIKSTKEIYANTTHPVCYVVGWDNNNNLKDLTRKYVPHFNTETRKLRVDALWWNKAVQPYLGPKKARDKVEDEYLDRMQLEAPLPTVIGEYKNHPLYVLKRHLLKFEAIYPPDATVLGFVRGEPVYARECVYTCRSRNIWYKKHAKVVRLGEKAYKMVKAQPRWDKINRKIITDDPPMEIFGPWQVDDFEPPVAENGIVPRNEYGNVELFKQCMLPKGTVHLKLPGLNRIAKKLNIDCATAITGFEVNHGWVRPVYEGFVVCKEFENIITEAWADDQEEQERKELEKTELRVYGNWKRLIKGLLIRERLKNKYGFNESSSSTTNKGKSKGAKHVTKKMKK